MDFYQGYTGNNDIITSGITVVCVQYCSLCSVVLAVHIGTRRKGSSSFQVPEKFLFVIKKYLYGFTCVCTMVQYPGTVSHLLTQSALITAQDPHLERANVPLEFFSVVQYQVVPN
jgi:hypothetical protein